MNTIRLRRAPGDGAIIIHADPCISCGGCGRSSARVHSSRRAEELDFSILPQDQYRILWNSLGKPIGYMLVATLMAHVFGLSEPENVVAAVTGFVVGYLNCVALPETLLEKIGVS